MSNYGAFVEHKEVFGSVESAIQSVSTLPGTEGKVVASVAVSTERNSEGLQVETVQGTSEGDPADRQVHVVRVGHVIEYVIVFEDGVKNEQDGIEPGPGHEEDTSEPDEGTGPGGEGPGANPVPSTEIIRAGKTD